VTLPGDRPQGPGADDAWKMPLNPCVACWRGKRLLIPSSHVAENAIRRITLCDLHTNEFKEIDQDYRGGPQSKGRVVTTYRAINPGERIVIDGGLLS
jgi:hypothetical protein